MAEGYTAFMTYMFSGETGTTNVLGYKNAIHCNYINSLQFNTLTNKEFNIYFENVEDFKFLSVSGGTGFSANKLIVIAQLIDNSKYENINQVKPKSNEWVTFDVTNQIIGYTSGQTLSPSDVTSTVFRVPISNYQQKKNNNDFYTLDYLNYPLSGSSELSFGDETFFFGNVKTSVEAIAYSTDLAINLPLNQFNSTTNKTWDKIKQISISEIGLYDENKNLVAIAKLNDPIPKDNTISRTIVFGLDF